MRNHHGVVSLGQGGQLFELCKTAVGTQVGLIDIQSTRFQPGCVSCLAKQVFPGCKIRIRQIADGGIAPNVLRRQQFFKKLQMHILQGKEDACLLYTSRCV